MEHRVSVSLPVQHYELPATACLRLLSAFDTSVSEHTALQAVADRIAAACHNHTCRLLAAEGPAGVNAEVQELLLQYLGPLQDMLNDKRRRELFMELPFEMLRVSTRCPADLIGLAHCHGCSGRCYSRR